MATSAVQARVKTCQAAIKAGDFAAAKDAAEGGLAASPDSVDLLLLAAFATSNLNRPLEAKQYLTRALKADPSNLQAKQGLLDVYKRTDDWDGQLSMLSSLRIDACAVSGLKGLARIADIDARFCIASFGCALTQAGSADTVDGKPATHVVHMARAIDAVTSCIETLHSARSFACSSEEGGFLLDPARARALEVRAQLTLPLVIEARIVLGVPSANHFSTAGTAGAGAGIDPGPPGLPPLLHRLLSHGPSLHTAYAKSLRVLLRMDRAAGGAEETVTGILASAPALSSLPPVIARESISILRRAVALSLDLVKVGWAGAESALSRVTAAEVNLQALCMSCVQWCLGLQTVSQPLHATVEEVRSLVSAVYRGPDGLALLTLLAAACETALAWCWTSMPAAASMTLLHTLECVHSQLGSVSPIVSMAKLMLSSVHASASTIDQPGTTAANAQQARYQALSTCVQEAHAVISSFPSAVASGLPWLSSCVAALHMAAARVAPLLQARVTHCTSACAVLKGHLVSIGAGPILQQCSVSIDGASGLNMSNSALGIRKPEAWTGAAVHGMVLGTTAGVLTSPAPLTEPSAAKMPTVHADVSVFSLGAWLPTKASPLSALPLIDAPSLAAAAGKQAKGQQVGPVSAPSLTPVSDAELLTEALAAQTSRMSAAGASSAGHRSSQFCIGRLYGKGITPSAGVLKLLSALCVCLSTFPDNAGPQSRECIGLATALYPRLRDGAVDAASCGLPQLAAHLYALAARVGIAACQVTVRCLPCGISSASTHLVSPRGCMFVVTTLPRAAQGVQDADAWLNQAQDAKNAYLSHVGASDPVSHDLILSLSSLYCLLSIMTEGITAEDKQTRRQGLHKCISEAKEGRKATTASSCMPWLFWSPCMSFPPAPTLCRCEYGPVSCLWACDDRGLSDAYHTAALAAWCNAATPTGATVQPVLLSALAYDPCNASAWALIGTLFACPQRTDDSLCAVGIGGRPGKAVNIPHEADTGPRNATRARACLMKALDLSPSHPIAGPLVMDALLGGAPDRSTAAVPAGNRSVHAVFTPDLMKAKALALAACADSNAPWAHWRAAALYYAEAMRSLAQGASTRAAAEDLQQASTCVQVMSPKLLSQDLQDNLSSHYSGHLDAARVQKAAAESSFLSCCSHYDRALAGVVGSKQEPRLRNYLPSITAQIVRPYSWNDTDADTYVACWSGLAACYAAQGRPAACQAAALSAVEAAAVFSDAWKAETTTAGTSSPYEHLRAAQSSVHHLCRAVVGSAFETSAGGQDGRGSTAQQLMHWLTFVPRSLLLQLANAERTLGNYETALLLCHICTSTPVKDSQAGDMSGVYYCLGAAHRAMARRQIGDGVVGEGLQHAIAGAQAAAAGLEATKDKADHALHSISFYKLHSDCSSIAYDACPFAVHPVAMAVACGKAVEAVQMIEAVEPEEVPYQSWVHSMRSALSLHCQTILAPLGEEIKGHAAVVTGGEFKTRAFAGWLMQNIGLPGSAVAKALSLVPTITHASLPSACMGARALCLGSVPRVWNEVAGSWLAALQSSLAVVQEYMVALEGRTAPGHPYLLPALCTALCDCGRLLYMGQQACVTACGSTGAGVLQGLHGGGQDAQGSTTALSPILAHAAHLRLLSSLVHSLACTVDPSNPRAWNGLGCTDAVPARAQHALIRSVATGGGGIPLVNLGALYLSQGALDAARAVLLQAQTQDPSNESMWLTVGALGDGAAWVDALAGKETQPSTHAGDAYVLATQLTLHPSATLPAALHGLGLLPWYARCEGNQPFITPTAWTLAQQAVESDPCNPLAWLAYSTARADSACQATAAALWPEWTEVETAADTHCGIVGTVRIVGRMMQPLQVGKLHAFLTSFKHRTSVSLQAPAARSAARAWAEVHGVVQAASARALYVLQVNGLGKEHEGPLLAAQHVMKEAAQLYEAVCCHYSGDRQEDGTAVGGGLPAWAEQAAAIKRRIEQLLASMQTSDTIEDGLQEYCRLQEPAIHSNTAPGPVEELQSGLASLTCAASMCASALSLHHDAVAQEWMQEVTSWGFEYGLFASLCSALGLSPLHSYALALGAQSGLLPGDDALRGHIQAAVTKASAAAQATRTAQTQARYESRMSMGAAVPQNAASSGPDSPQPPVGLSWRTPSLATAVSTVSQQVQAAGALALALGGVGGYDATMLRRASARAALSLQQQL